MQLSGRRGKENSFAQRRENHAERRLHKIPDTTGRHVGRFYDDEVYSPGGAYLGVLRNKNRLITCTAKKGRRSYTFAPYAPRVGYVPYVDYVGYVMYVGYEDFPAPADF